MTCMVIGMILGFLQIIQFGWTGVTPAFAWGVFNFYNFVCLTSLYKKLEAERKNESKYVYISAISRT